MNRSQSQSNGPKVAEEQEEAEARAARLCFILKLDRADDDAVDLAGEAFVAHKCRFLTLAQFATYVDFAMLQKHLPPPIVVGWRRSVRFLGSRRRISVNIHSGFFPIDQAEGKAKKGKGKGKALASGCFVCGGPHYKIDCPVYYEQRLQQRTQNRKGQGKGNRPRPWAPAAHHWRVVQRSGDGKGAAGNSSDAVVCPPDRAIAQDLAMKGMDRAKGKGKGDKQQKGKDKSEPQKG